MPHTQTQRINNRHTVKDNMQGPRNSRGRQRTWPQSDGVLSEGRKGRLVPIQTHSLWGWGGEHLQTTAHPIPQPSPDLLPSHSADTPARLDSVCIMGVVSGHPHPSLPCSLSSCPLLALCLPAGGVWSPSWLVLPLGCEGRSRWEEGLTSERPAPRITGCGTLSFLI